MSTHRPRLSRQPGDKPPREIELKLAVPVNLIGAITEYLRSLSAGPTKRRHEVTTYFDTPDQALRRAGVSLRVRASGGEHVQTLKANRQDGVAADRAEWEWPVQNDQIDLRLLEQTPIAKDLPPRPVLEPMFTIENDRTTRILDLNRGTVVEAAYDEGLIITENAHEPVRELELELRKGDLRLLYREAMKLHAEVPLPLESESKAARGYRLKSGAKPKAQKSKDVQFTKRTSTVEAFRQILAAELGHLLANQPAALSGDAEGVHQMRVAIRRLRATLALYQPHLEPQATALFQNELRRIGRVFGEARDWDVFCLQILPDTLEAGWRDLLLPPATAARAAAYQNFSAEVCGPTFTGLVLGLAAWTEETPLPGKTARKSPIEDMAPALLDRLAHKVGRRGRHIAQRSDTERHALRKSLKKLRYGVDFMGSVLPPRPLKHYLHACKELQRTLGDLNDTVAATALAKRLVDGSGIDLTPAVSALATEMTRRREHASCDLARQWKAFAEQACFWA